MLDLCNIDTGRLSDFGNKGFALGITDTFKPTFSVSSTYHSDWLIEYSKNGWVACDPIVQTALRSSREAGKAELWPTLVAADPMFRDAAIDFGLTQGLLVGSDIGGSKAICGLALDRVASPTQTLEFEAEVHRLHTKELATRALSLTKAERELMYLFAHGYRAKNVAYHFDISEDAIKQRKLRILSKIGTSNFIVAIHICAVAGITTHPLI